MKMRPKAPARLMMSILAMMCVAAATASVDPLIGLPASHPVIEFTTSEFTQPGLELSGDGKTLYFDVLGEIYAVPIEGGRAQKIDLGTGWKQRPILSPDGSRLGFLSDRNGPYGVWVKKLGSKEAPIAYDIRENADVTSAVWVSNSEVVSTGRGLEGPAGYSLLTSSEGRLDSLSIDVSEVQRAASITKSVDGRYLYFLRGYASLNRLDRVTGIETTIVKLPGGASQLRMAPDGIHLGFVPETKKSGDDSILSLVNLKTGAVTQTKCAMERDFDTVGDGALQANYSFMPNGRSVVLGRGGSIRLCALDGSTSIIPISADIRIPMAPRARWQDRQIGPQLRFPAAAPSGNQLAFTARGHIWLLDLRDGAVKRLTRGTELEYMPSYAPNGSEIAFVGLASDGSSLLRVRNIRSGVERVILSSRKVIANPAWSPDGHRLAFAEAPPNLTDRDKTQVELGWIDIRTKQRGVFVKNQFPDGLRNLYYPRLTWDRESEGIFYSTKQEEWPSNRFLMYQKIGQASKALYDIEWSAQDVLISPSGRYIAVMDKAGISVAPAAGSSVERLTIDRALVSGLKRVTGSIVDYMAWLPDDRLVWSTQDEVFVSDANFDQKKSIKVAIPKSESTSSPGRIAYVGARIITMTDKKTVEDGLVVTNGARIEYVGPMDAASIGSAEIVDVKGKTIIPGLVDVHQHGLTMNREVTPELSHRLFASAAYGVTTIYDPAFTDIEGSVLREQSSEDSYVGATLYTAGTILLGAEGTPADIRIESYEDAVKHVRRKAQAGSVMVKDYLQPTRIQRRWLAQAALELGVGITGHERNDVRTHMTMVVDGYGGLEHAMLRGTRMYGDVQRFLVASGISMTPTLVDSFGLWGGTYFDRSSPPADQYLRCLTSDAYTTKLARMRAQQVGKSIQESAGFDVAKQYAKMLNDGGFVTIGAHAMPEGIGTHWEMWYLEMAGATPLNVLRAATINGAKKLDLESRIGSLVAGMDADFLVLNSNPLDDIKNTTDISRVVRRGRTLNWPAQTRQPTTWTMQASWEECKRWNFGLAH